MELIEYQLKQLEERVTRAKAAPLMAKPGHIEGAVDQMLITLRLLVQEVREIKGGDNAKTDQ